MGHIQTGTVFQVQEYGQHPDQEHAGRADRRAVVLGHRMGAGVWTKRQPLHRTVKLFLGGHGKPELRVVVLPVCVRCHRRHHRIWLHRRALPVQRLLHLLNPHHRRRLPASQPLGMGRRHAGYDAHIETIGSTGVHLLQRSTSIQIAYNMLNGFKCGSNVGPQITSCNRNPTRLHSAKSYFQHVPHFLLKLIEHAKSRRMTGSAILQSCHSVLACIPAQETGA